MLQYFNELFHYNNWANGETIKALEHPQNTPPDCIELFSHIISAQQMWLQRVDQQLDCTAHIHKDYSLNQSAAYSIKNTHEWLELVSANSREDLEREIQYHNARGKIYASQLWQIMSHVLNHSTYHRGQINRILRENHLPTAPCDYIFYTRVKN